MFLASHALRPRFTREDHAYGASRLPKMEENDCFAVYNCCVWPIKALVPDSLRLSI